jgi:cytochrome b561
MTETAYDARLRWIHWASAVLFIAAMLIGFYCGLQAPGTSPRRELLEVHKSLGVTLFFLAVLRIMVRAGTRAPPEPQSYGLMVRMAARLNHWVLYAVLLAMPISGYLFSSAGGYSLKYFWIFSWPRLVSGNPFIAHAGEVSHDTLAYLVYAAVALHIMATIWHAAVKKDATLSRMWPARSAESAAGQGPAGRG